MSGGHAHIEQEVLKYLAHASRVGYLHWWGYLQWVLARVHGR